MDELDRYLETEYRNADDRRYRVQTHQPRVLGRLLGFLANWFRFRSDPSSKGELINLTHGQLSIWEVRRAATAFCEEGVVWLTRTGDSKDYLLSAGESMILKPGQWILQALDFSTVQKKTLEPLSTVIKEVSHDKATLFPVLQRV